MPKKKQATDDQVQVGRRDLLPETCTAAEFSNLIGVAIRNVRDLAAKGVMVPGKKRGEFLTGPSLLAYVEDMRNKAAGRATANGVNLADERALLAREQRIEQERKNKVAAGEMISVDEAKEGWSRIGAAFRSAVLGLPSRIRAVVPSLTPHDGQAIAEQCREVLGLVADELESGGHVAGSRGSETELKDA